MDFFFIIFSTLFTVLISYLSYKYRYWEQQNVPQLKMNFLYGNFFRLRSVHKAELMHAVYQQFRAKAKVAGTYIYTKPIAVILDLDIIKAILIKDFNKFTDRFTVRSEYITSTIETHLFVLPGDRWRRLRTKLTPTFTSAKMKFMFPTLMRVARQLDEAFQAHLDKAPSADIELHDMMGRFTTDVIGQCAFGVECNSLKDPNVEFRHIGRLIFYPRIISIRWRLFLATYPGIFRLFKLFKLKRVSPAIEEFVVRLVRDTVRLREEQNIQRNDFLNLLIEMKNTKDENGVPLITLDDTAAQVFIFFAAGFETSSSNMSFGLYELAKHPHIQDKVRAEIVSVLKKHNDEVTYEAMMEMTYLDNIITETLRMYPALGALNRVAMDDYKIPGTEITLEKGTDIYIPAKEIHYDPDIYDKPEEFRPERFNCDEVQKRHPLAFLGFGDGPRNCIGLRFGKMQVRVGLITLLKSYRFSLSAKTPAKLEIANKSLVMLPQSKVWLRAEKL